MPQSFGQKDYTDIDRLRDIIGRVSQADLRQRLFVADQARTKQERAQISNVLESYSQAVGTKKRSTRAVTMPQFGGLTGMQDVEEPISAGDEAAEAAKAVSRLTAIGGPEAKQATQSLIEMRKGNITEEEKALDRALKASMFNESQALKTRAESTKEDVDKQKLLQGQQKLDLDQKKLDATERHNKAVEDLKREASNVLKWDENGKITINPAAKPADVLKIYPTYVNAITSGVMRMAFTAESDTVSRQAIQTSIKELQNVGSQLGDLISKGLGAQGKKGSSKEPSDELKAQAKKHLDDQGYESDDEAVKTFLQKNPDWKP